MTSCPGIAARENLRNVCGFLGELMVEMIGQTVAENVASASIDRLVLDRR